MKKSWDKITVQDQFFQEQALINALYIATFLIVTNNVIMLERSK